jgi:Domain of unknown function (DUF4900)
MQLSVMVSHKRQQGISLITSLIVIALVAAVILIMTGRTLSELSHSRDNSGVVQTLLLARGSARLGQDYLYSDHLKDLLKNSLTKLTKGSTKRWFFGENTFAIPSEISIATDMKPLAADLQTLLDQDFCGQEVIPTGTTSKMKLRIYVTRTACSLPLSTKIDLPLARLVNGAPRGASTDPKVPMQEQRQTYALPFVLIAEGEQGIYKRNIALQGEIRFTAGKSTFSRYAYFTNEDAEANLWFSTSTLINGPIHTNSNFRFDGNPWFGSTVSSAGCQSASTGTCGAKVPGAIFGTGGGGNIIDPSAMADPQNPSFNGATPTMVKGVDWNANYIELPKNNLSQKYASQGRNKDNTADLATQGLYFLTDLDSLTLTVTDANDVPLQPNGIAADGTPLWTPATSEYQHITACKGPCTEYRIGKDKVIQKLDITVTPNVWVVVGTRPFNGVIFADGKIERLTGPARSPAGSTKGEDAGPAIAAFSELTVASDTDIRITGDLKYEQPPHSGIAKRNPDGTVTPPTDINDGAINVLGVYSAGGNILIGNQHNSDATLNAPDNAMVHASLMSSTGKIQVEKFDQGSCRGNFQLIGGMIQTRRGPFYTFSGSTCKSGFSRTYTYDQRFMFGISPPFFPTAGESDPDNVFVFTFGQREQVY